MASASSATPSPTVEPEALKPKEDTETITKTENAKVDHHELNENEKKRHNATFKPSHKATFLGLGVVIIILAINVGVIVVLLGSQSNKNKSINDKGVSISPAVLSKLGVNNAQIGSGNEQLIVDPSAQFNSGLTVAGDVKIGGKLQLNSTFSATSANLTQLQAGNTSLSSLNVNGNSTASNLSVRGNLGVSGSAVFQNTLSVGQILTVNNSAAVANNLSVGGELTANTIATSNLILSGSIVFGSHILTSGTAPTAVPGGSADGSNGTVSIGGDDAAGTINVNIGYGATSGVLVKVAFHNAYSAQPRVVISPVGIAAVLYIEDPTTEGFYVADASGLPIGGFSINYIVEQ